MWNFDNPESNMSIGPSSSNRVQDETGANDGCKFDSPANFVFEFSPHLDETSPALRMVRVTSYREQIAPVALKGQTEGPHTQWRRAPPGVWHRSHLITGVAWRYSRRWKGTIGLGLCVDYDSVSTLRGGLLGRT